MKFGVVIFPGSNCDQDIIFVLECIMKQKVCKLWHKSTQLPGVNESDCIILPGGFSYGDYLRSGAIARFSPIMSSIVSFANAGGIVLGICNGFQILCESGLLPGTLLKNNTQKFSCKNVFICVQTKDSLLSSKLPQNKALKIPIAHSEGRFFVNKNVLKDLNKNNQIIFKYCSESAEVTEEFNPNGSLENIAGICNKTRNVYGMMPHPERAADSILSNTDSYLIFESLLNNNKN